MLRKLLFIVSIILAFACCALAQGVYTPEKNSPERKEILDALRIPVENALNQKIQFSINIFNVQGNSAFLSGAPLTPDGKNPDYKGTTYQEAIDNGAFDNNFSALLKKTAGKWKVVTYRIGCTDVCYITWWKDYKAPKAIFPGDF